jgi:hypothetical protein
MHASVATWVGYPRARSASWGAGAWSAYAERLHYGERLGEFSCCRPTAKRDKNYQPSHGACMPEPTTSHTATHVTAKDQELRERVKGLTSQFLQRGRPMQSGILSAR